MSNDEKDNKIKAENGEIPRNPDGTFQTGKPGGPGRPKGAPNKVTAELRESFKLIAENQAPKLEDALNTLFEEDPDKAIKHLLALSEYVTPKLARSEITGADEGPVQLYLVDRIVDPESDEDDTD